MNKNRPGKALKKIVTLVFLLLSSAIIYSAVGDKLKTKLNDADISNGEHHFSHFEIFSKYTSGFNLDVLKGIDAVQKSAPEGGGYFIGIKADPPESPIGYSLKLGSCPLVDPARKTSYCSGASFSAFIEGLNSYLEGKETSISKELEELLRMQEKDGGRREDKIKFWGNWNADGYGNHFALVQYFNAGEVIKPEDAQPGDFMNISWNNGGGHSVIFLGWYVDENEELHVVYWSSQKGTNGLGDDVVPVDRINEVMVVRVTDPDEIISGDANEKVDYKISGYKIGQ